MYRQLDPILLDEKLSACNTSTFNLATPATYNPESYFLYEKLLIEENPQQLKFVFMELQPLVDIEEKNIKTDQSYYWMNLNDWAYAVRYSIASNYSTRIKLGLIADYSQSYIYRVLFNQKVLFLSDQYIGDLNLIGQQGYYSLDVHMQDLGSESGLRNRFNHFTANPEELFERIAYIDAQFSLADHSEHLNHIHIDKLQELINLSDEHGIHLVFIIPPRLHEKYEELLAIKTQLPNDRIIEVANHEQYPEMYDLAYSFDAGHLNAEGASIFTEYAADQILNICSTLD